MCLEHLFVAKKSAKSAKSAKKQLTESRLGDIIIEPKEISEFKKGLAKHMGKILVFANEKGGIGKTTSAVNVAACMGAKETLLIDSDPQGNATSGVGINKKTAGAGVYEVISGQVSAEKAAIKTKFDNLWLIPSNIALAGAAYELISRENYNKLMKNALEGIKDGFDYIVIDCPPSLGLLTVNALAAADGVIIPMNCEFYALEGLSQMMLSIRQVKKTLNPQLDITGILITMFDRRLNLSKMVLDELKKYYKDKLLEPYVTRNVRLTEAPSFGEPIIYFDKSSKGAQAYEKLSLEIMKRI